MAAYLGYTLRMRMLFRGWPIMVNDTHTRRRRLTLLQLTEEAKCKAWRLVATGSGTGALGVSFCFAIIVAVFSGYSFFLYVSVLFIPSLCWNCCKEHWKESPELRALLQLELVLEMFHFVSQWLLPCSSYSSFLYISVLFIPSLCWNCCDRKRKETTELWDFLQL